jgi:O-methyltransferase
VVIDDYGHWEGCKKAVDEFFQERAIKPYLHYIDYTGRYFFKP